MKLRILRMYDWMLDCSPAEIKFGGINPHKLVHYDKLQELQFDEFGENGKWIDVEIVEIPAPPHPNTFKILQNIERTNKKLNFDDVLNKLRNEPVDED
jgi:hypothetical protein